jgi:hypothetical protein
MNPVTRVIRSGSPHPTPINIPGSTLSTTTDSSTAFTARATRAGPRAGPAYCSGFAGACGR